MHIRLGTRGSSLAMWQAHYIRALILRTFPSHTVDVVPVKTEGDLRRRAQLAGSGTTGIFTRAIGLSLLDNDINLAVHSLKDLPTRMMNGLHLAGVPRRQDPADGLISKRERCLEELPDNAIVLTGSPRRRAQLLHRRPDLEVREVRGNVPTRIQKMHESAAEGVMLACAGLARMGMAHVATHRLDPLRFVPAAGQGALGLECRADDGKMLELCRALNNVECEIAAKAERGFMRTLGAGCHVPAGAFARRTSPCDPLQMTGLLATADGTDMIREEVSGEVHNPEEATELGRQLAETMLERSSEEILEEF